MHFSFTVRCFHSFLGDIWPRSSRFFTIHLAPPFPDKTNKFIEIFFPGVEEVTIRVSSTSFYPAQNSVKPSSTFKKFYYQPVNPSYTITIRSTASFKIVHCRFSLTWGGQCLFFPSSCLLSCAVRNIPFVSFLSFDLAVFCSIFQTFSSPT